MILKLNLLATSFPWPQPIWVLSKELLKTKMVRFERNSAVVVTIMFSKFSWPLPSNVNRKNTVSESLIKLHCVKNWSPSEILNTSQKKVMFSASSTADTIGYVPSPTAGMVEAL